MEEEKWTTVRVSKETAKRLRIFCAVKGITPGKLIEEYINKVWGESGIKI